MICQRAYQQRRIIFAWTVRNPIGPRPSFRSADTSSSSAVTKVSHTREDLKEDFEKDPEEDSEEDPEENPEEDPE